MTDASRQILRTHKVIHRPPDSYAEEECFALGGEVYIVLAHVVAYRPHSEARKVLSSTGTEVIPMLVPCVVEIPSMPPELIAIPVDEFHRAMVRFHGGANA